MLLFPADCYYGIVVVRSICRWIQIHLLLYRSFIRRAILNEGVLYRYLVNRAIKVLVAQKVVFEFRKSSADDQKSTLPQYSESHKMKCASRNDYV